MKKLKLILPMLAFIMAVGLSFAFEKDNRNALNGYVYDSGDWIEVDVLCIGTAHTCTVQFVDEFDNPVSDVLDVYPVSAFKDDFGNDIEPLKSSTRTPQKIMVQE